MSPNGSPGSLTRCATEGGSTRPWVTEGSRGRTWVCEKERVETNGMNNEGAGALKTRDAVCKFSVFRCRTALQQGTRSRRPRRSPGPKDTAMNPVARTTRRLFDNI